MHSSTVTIPLTINGKEFKEDFVIFSDEDMANFQAHYGITVHGLLGNEFLDRTKCHIDYNKHTITLF